MESEVREVSFEDALAEEAATESGAAPEANVFMRTAPQAQGAPAAPAPPIPQDHDQAGDQEPAPQAQDPSISEREAQKAEIDEEFAALSPPEPAKAWTFGQGELERTYIQSELSVIGSAQWFKLLGEFLDEAMSGENSLSLNSLMAPPTPRTPGQLQMADFQDADMFVHALAKLLTVMPDFLEKSICIWLDVPDYESELIGMLMRKSPSQGGMSHDMFEGILMTFIDQNYAEIDRFFRERFPRLRARYQARAKEVADARSRSPKR